jgi:hypothetical protein
MSMDERYVIDLISLPDHLQKPGEKWQATCANDHALGETPTDAVGRLIDHIRAARRRPTPKDPAE